MKHLLPKINTKTIQSIIAGFALALMLIAGTSMAQQNTLTGWITGNEAFIDRNGSLSVGEPTTPNWIKEWVASGGSTNRPNPRCISSDETTDDGISSVLGDETCLSVSGGTSFANLWVDRPAYLNGITAVGGALSRGVTLFPQSSTAQFIIQNTVGLLDSMLVTGLAYRNAEGDFSPRNLTTKRGVCARENGTLFVCSQPDVVTPTEPTLVYNWNTVWGACSDSTPSTGSCTGNYHATTKVAAEEFASENTYSFNWEPSRIYDFADGFNSFEWPNSSNDYLSPGISGQYDACINTSVQAVSPSSVATNNFDKSNQLWEYRFSSFRDDIDIAGPLYTESGYEPQYYDSYTGSGDPDDSNNICTTASVTSSDLSEQEWNTLRRAWEPINPLDPPTIACQGATATACLANNGFDGDNCSWETTAVDQSGSTQSGTTTCRDQNGNIVSDNLCTEPRPATSRACQYSPYQPRVTGDSNICDTETNRYQPQIDCFLVSSDGTEEQITDRSIQECYIGSNLALVAELRDNHIGASCQ